MDSMTTPQTYTKGEDGNQIQSKEVPEIQPPNIPSHTSIIISHGGSTTGPNGKLIQSKLLVPSATYSTPTKFTPFRPLDLYSTSLQSFETSNRRVQNSTPKNPNSKIPESKIKAVVSDVDTSANPSFGLHSPPKPRPTSALFKQEEERSEGEEKIALLVQAIEEEMQKAGTRVDCSELKSQLNLLRAKESIPKGASSSTGTGNSLKKGFHFSTPTTPSTSVPSHPPN